MFYGLVKVSKLKHIPYCTCVALSLLPKHEDLEASIMSVLLTRRSPGPHAMPSAWYLLNN